MFQTIPVNGSLVLGTVVIIGTFDETDPSTCGAGRRATFKFAGLGSLFPAVMVSWLSLFSVIRRNTINIIIMNNINNYNKCYNYGMSYCGAILWNLHIAYLSIFSDP